MNSDMPLSICFVVPCKNEAKNISFCLDSIVKQDFQNSTFDIFVVDNGSTDNTLEIINNYVPKINTFILKDVSISELRNYGAKKSNSDWIAFIDADVELDINWFTNLMKVIHKLINDGIDGDRIITGSMCDISQNSTWLERVWSTQLRSKDKSITNYINSANLVINRKLFERIGGFDPNYKTAEDEKICKDAMALGAIVFRDNSIRAIHHGYPKSIRDFFKRERWHGFGMMLDFPRFWKSRALTLTLFYVFLIVLYIFIIFIFDNIVNLSIIILIAFFIPILILAIIRSKHNPRNIIFLVLLYFVYGWARVLSLFDFIFNNIIKRFFYKFKILPKNWTR